jgi:hypothetical protein
MENNKYEEEKNMNRKNKRKAARGKIKRKEGGKLIK